MSAPTAEKGDDDAGDRHDDAGGVRCAAAPVAALRDRQRFPPRRPVTVRPQRPLRAHHRAVAGRGIREMRLDGKLPAPMIVCIDVGLGDHVSPAAVLMSCPQMSRGLGQDRPADGGHRRDAPWAVTLRRPLDGVTVTRGRSARQSWHTRQIVLAGCS